MAIRDGVKSSASGAGRSCAKGTRRDLLEDMGPWKPPLDVRVHCVKADVARVTSADE